MTILKAALFLCAFLATSRALSLGYSFPPRRPPITDIDPYNCCRCQANQPSNPICAVMDVDCRQCLPDIKVPQQPGGGGATDFDPYNCCRCRANQPSNPICAVMDVDCRQCLPDIKVPQQPDISIYDIKDI